MFTVNVNDCKKEMFYPEIEKVTNNQICIDDEIKLIMKTMRNIFHILSSQIVKFTLWIKLAAQISMYVTAIVTKKRGVCECS